ncbi:hypothetical protein FGSG_00725 [Fusarium graminearum PH-1]|uniref:Zn(2)-C6 fungal-type domain-containing protein n=1 Tax=Gibberella zeae (strain ATCC MYA-4620 / CBS 123657 / FGSC 9075 / NRRL 31084 / PH-1) TaxID=229533 RepID=I1RB21_GIBZE|nr:hypothetical protein FGSG_00725 [Fusarium graminearum PH-1]ESU05947.1 hypothetical protein FGSG_00725 [Fusarium graminearum PH-1]|eukprot:XP_011316432.1 hypothetical protein FGSG_00725 [Fusarium graminearum PH-1]
MSVCQTMADSSQDDISGRAELDSGQKRNRPERSNAKVRASIACVPCRSKHTKCDGFIPSCTRCKEEGKRCHYVSSRRGIRDPKKRNMIRDEVSMTDQDDTTESTPSPNLSSLHHPLRNALDLYYANFHLAHSWAPPKRILERLLEEGLNDMQFLEATIAYIASRYSLVDTVSLWERVYKMSHEELTPTLWNVQALLSLSIASFSERDNFYPSLFNRARGLALVLDLRPKAYADQRDGPYIAESCRRTYWGLFVHEMLLSMRDDPMHSSLCPPKSTGSIEIPCEEWEYESGKFPAQVPLAEYGHLGASCGQSSWACFVNLIRIYDRCVAQFLHTSPWDTSFSALEDASQRIDRWRNTIEGSKMEWVDEDGTVDMILYSALIVSYDLQIRMQRHFYDIQKFANGEHPNPYIPRLHEGVPVEFDPSLSSILQAAPLRLVSLFNHVLPKKISPSCIPCLDRAARLLNEQSYYRHKVDFFSSILRKAGEHWSMSKRISEYLEQTPTGADNGTSHATQLPTLTANTSAVAYAVPQADNPHGIPSTTGYWSGVTPQSVRDMLHFMDWPEQSFGGSSMPYVLPTTTAESFQSLDVDAGSSGEQSPHVKTERHWT